MRKDGKAESRAFYPTERLRMQHWLMDVSCACTTARGGTVAESSCSFGTNEAVEYRDIRIFAVRDPKHPPNGVRLGLHVQLRLLKGMRTRGIPYAPPCI